MDRSIPTSKFFCKGFKYHVSSESLLKDYRQYNLPARHDLYASSPNYGDGTHSSSEIRGQEFRYFAQESLGKPSLSSDFLYFLVYL